MATPLPPLCEPWARGCSYSPEGSDCHHALQPSPRRCAHVPHHSARLFQFSPMGVLWAKLRRNFGSNTPLSEKLQRVRRLFLSSIPLSGRLVTCPWYWEYHSVEFSVPASVQNLELSVPTHLVLTFCKEKSLICIRMSHKETLCCPNWYKQKHQKHFSKLVVRKNLFCCVGRWGKWTFH